MSAFPTFTYFTALSLLIFHFDFATPSPNSSFQFEDFGRDSSFESLLGLYGDAKVINGGSSVEIGGSSRLTAGRLVYRKPIKLVEGNPNSLLSFSTDFSFSMSLDSKDGLAFVMFPIRFPFSVSSPNQSQLLSKRKFRVVIVKFDAIKGVQYGDLDSNHSSIISINLSNVSSMKLGLNSSDKLQAWINYVGGRKCLEIRLAKLGEIRPADPLISYPIDLSKIWKKKEDVFIGLSSSQPCEVYSWRFNVRRSVLPWMHSEPLDPNAFSQKAKVVNVGKRSDCVLRVVSALVFGTGCGALGAFVALVVWGVFGARRPVMPVEDCAVKFEHGKFKVVVDKAVEDDDGKK